MSAYIVTNYWAAPEHGGEEAAQTRAEMELQQAEIAAWAAPKKAADTSSQHVIWSTLEDTRHLAFLATDATASARISMGPYKVPHFDAKGVGPIRGLLRQVHGIPTTFLRTTPSTSEGSATRVDWVRCGIRPASPF